MLSTIKILQAKNASTGTISMSKRLMAIQETFSTNLGPNQGPPLPLSLTRNGDVNKNQKCETNSSSPPAPAPPTAPTNPVPPSSENGCKPTTASSSPPASNPSKPYKPNSLILVPNHQQNLSQMCNGKVRLVSQGRQMASKSAVEVQTEDSPSPPQHVSDCPFNTTKIESLPKKLPVNPVKKSSEPGSENSDDYLEPFVPDNTAGNAYNQGWIFFPHLSTTTLQLEGI